MAKRTFVFGELEDMISIKDIPVFKALLSKVYDPTLIEILSNVESFFPGICITEGYREGTGVHSTDPCRAIDLRSRNYTEEQTQTIKNHINNTWIYDPERPEMNCCMVHDVGRGMHFHLQSHPNTVRR